MKIKMFDEAHELDLEESVNKFLQKGNDIMDIKYQVSICMNGEEQLYSFSAMIIYNE